MVRHAAFVGVALLAIACGGVGSGPSPSRNLITLDEIQATPSANARELVHTLRPFWLTARGQYSPRHGRVLPVVYVDNVRMGEISTLEIIAVGTIQEIRYITGTEATTRWGTGVAGGVIHVITKK